MAKRKIRLIEITMQGKWGYRQIEFVSLVVAAAETIKDLNLSSAKKRALISYFGKSKYNSNKEKLMDVFKITHLKIVKELGYSNDVY